MVDDDYDSDELMWVKAGEPGEKPTIIRQIRSESSSSGSRDNSSGSSSSCGGHTGRRNRLTVENGTVYRTNGAGTSEESLNVLEKLARTSSSESRVIVVNVQEPIYPVHIDRQRIQKWKELHSPRTSKKDTMNSPKGKKTSNNNNTIERSHFKNQAKLSTTQRPLSQPTTTRPTSNYSPQAERCSSVDPKNSPHSRVALVAKTRDEGYTSLTEDCKDSDTDSVRSKTLPSSWRPVKSHSEQESFKRYAQQMTSNNSTDCNYLYHEDDCGVGGVDATSKPDEKLLNHNEKDTKLNDKGKEKKRSRLRHNVENAIEICTCFVCLRSAVYHAEDEDDTDSLVDHPCSCDAPGAKCCGRWAVISLMVCFLPFLLCYPPLKSCLCIHDRRKELKQAKKEEKYVKKQSKKKSKNTTPSSPKHKKDEK